MKRIFLTGASAGIGRAIAERLCADGHEVWGTSRDAERVPRLERLHPIALDLAKHESIGAAFVQALSEAGQFDVVINNAGSGCFGPAEALPDELFREQFQVLFFGQVELCKLAVRAMRPRRSGLIINVSSLASRLPVPFMAPYNAAKAAMAMFTMSLDLEVRHCGIRVVDLQPADIRTNFNDTMSRAGLDAPEYAAQVEKAYRAVDKNMREAPLPEVVARDVARIITSNDPPPRVTSGSAFQSQVAPFLLRLLPMRTQLWGLRKYYGI